MADVKRLIGDLGRLGTIYFSFSGGEPLLVPYMPDLLAFAKKSGILYTHVVSNGYLMDKDKAIRLADAGLSEISFSIDGDEKVHDRNRGMNGAFQKVLEAVEHVRAHSLNTKIVLNTILDPIHPENALFAVKTAGRLGTDIKVQPANDHPGFGAEVCAEKYRRSLQEEEKQKLLDAIDFLKEAPHVVNSKPFLENYKAFMFCPEKLALVNDDCIFGQHHIEIFSNRLYPCLEGMNWKDGFDISESSISKILESSRYRQKLQQLRGCAACRKNYYVCYYEPRLTFPVWNFVKSRIITKSC
jgi:sulfatase maturation enzyme AslB (radical SAM superfamily)